MYLVGVYIQRCAEFAKWLQTSKFVCVIYSRHSVAALVNAA
jgi:hypothetical protein